MFHEYPYTDYSNDMNCGMFMGLCSKAGVKLAFVGDSLQLLDKCNHVLSSVKILSISHSKPERVPDPLLIPRPLPPVDKS